MKQFLISVDSSACFSDEELSDYGILMVRLSYTLDGNEHVDLFEDDAQKQALYDALSAGAVAQSSKANPDAFRRTWEKPLREGFNILHLSLSSKVSGSYDSACQAAAELTAEYGGRIEVIDTLTGCFAITAMALELTKIQETATIDEAMHSVRNSLDEYNLVFAVADIQYLRRGGRVSHIKALLGGLLRLKPVLYINSEGRITFLANARGMRQAIETLTEKMKSSATVKTIFSFLAHGGDEESARRLQDRIKEAIPAVREFRLDYLTPVLGLHAGPGALVLCFRGAPRDHVVDGGVVKELLEKLHHIKQ